MSEKKEKVKNRYDKWTPFYDLVDEFPLVSKPQRKWKKEAIKHLEIAPRDRVLDVGTGTGQILPWIINEMESGELIGTDISESMIKRARDRVEETQENLEVKVLYDDIEESKFPNDHFDKIISTFTLTTIPDFESAVKECRRILKPEGKMIVLDTGKPNKTYAKPFFYPMMFSAKIFGRTHMDRNIQGCMDEYFRVKLIGEYMFGMVYIIEAKYI